MSELSVSEDQQTALFTHATGVQKTLFAHKSEKCNCIDCYLKVICRSGISGSRKCIKCDRSDNINIIWKVDPPSSIKKEEMERIATIDVAEDEQTATLTFKNGLKLGLKAYIIYNDLACANCHLNELCPSELSGKRMCSGITRHDSEFIAWHVDKIYKPEEIINKEESPKRTNEFIVVDEDQRSGILYDENGKSIKLIAKPCLYCVDCKFFKKFTCQLHKSKTIKYDGIDRCTGSGRKDETSICWVDE